MPILTTFTLARIPSTPLCQQHRYFRSVTVTAGQTYWWKVVAKVNCGSATATSTTRSFSVDTNCNAPGGFSLSSPGDGQSFNPTTTSVTLSWGASANADTYDVYFGTSSNPSFLGNQTGTSRVVTVAPGQTYWWKVIAKVNCSSATFTAGTSSFSIEGTASTNFALAANGGVASASSTLNGNYPASNVINGERAGANSSTGGAFNGWISGSPTMPQWLQVDFGQVRNLSEIDVLTIQDNYQNPATPTTSMTFSLYGLQGFEVQYWDGANWLTISGGSVSSNNKVWKQFFTPIATSRIRVLANASSDGFSRLTEVEAWSNPAPPSSVNVALAANGGVASASSTLNGNYPASNVINGERAGANSSTGGAFNGWISGSPTMPQWLQVDFGQVRNLSEIDVLTIQDNLPEPGDADHQHDLQPIRVAGFRGAVLGRSQLADDTGWQRVGQQQGLETILHHDCD